MKSRKNVQEFLDSLRHKEGASGLSIYPGVQAMDKRRTVTRKRTKAGKGKGRRYPTRRYPARRYPAKRKHPVEKKARRGESRKRKITPSRSPRKRK